MIEIIGHILVNVSFEKTGADAYTLRRKCGQCECSATCTKMATPMLRSAADSILCFNDISKQGISGKGCSGKVIRAGSDWYEFEINANIQLVT